MKPSAARTFRAVAVDPVTPFRSRHPLPRRGPFDRHRALIETARGHSVLHLGFVDEQLEAKAEEGVWLHARLAAVARSLVGLDSSVEGVEWARAQGYEAQVVDVQSEESVSAAGVEPAEVLIAGELIEHLDAPGPFLRALGPLVAEDGVLVLTTPNAYRLLSFLAPLTGAEIIHPDHTAWHSPQTLRTLLRQGGWHVVEMAYYHSPIRVVPARFRGRRRVVAHLANLLRRVLVLLGRPLRYWSEGIIVWARPHPESRSLPRPN